MIETEGQTENGPTLVANPPAEAAVPMMAPDSPPGDAGGAAGPGTGGGEACPAPTALLPSQVEELKAQAAKASENWDRYVRAMADLDNFRKRAARERQEASRYANESLLTKLAPVLDNFDMALVAAQNTPGATVESLKAGVAMISSQLRSVLAEAGLEEIDATDKAFDPNWHEAVAQQESADIPEGQVVQQLRKGYKFRDRLIRPASVVVSKKPAAAAA